MAGLFDRAAFAACLEDCLTRLDATVLRLGIAVSGGPDSMALALLAVEYATQHGIELHSFTVDHRLRPESEAEAAQVAQWMAARGISHRTLVWEHSDQISGNLQDAARTARYALLTAACHEASIPALLLGHQQDDQAETLLHHLARGSGVDGLSAIAPARLEQGIWLLRPLLATQKSALIAHCEAANQPFVMDPSNENPRFARSMLRSMLAQFAPQGLTAARIAETAHHMGRAKSALDYYTAQAVETCVRHGAMGCTRLDLARWNAEPEEIRLRVLRAILLAWNPEAKPRFAALQDLQARLQREPSGRHTLGPLLWQWRAHRVQCHRVHRYLPAPATNSAEALAEWAALGWHMTLPESMEGLTLAPVGETGWEFLCAKDRPNIRIARRLAPPAAWQAMPALWESAYGYLAKPAVLPHIYPAGEPLPITPPSPMGACSRFAAHWQTLG